MNEDCSNARAPRPSPLVELELAILSGDPAPEPIHAGDKEGARRVLVVAADPDVGGYIAACLAGRSDLHVLIAASAAVALEVVGAAPPDLVIVVNGDAPEDLFPQIPTIGIRSAYPAKFHERGLLEQVDRLLEHPHDSEEHS